MRPCRLHCDLRGFMSATPPAIYGVRLGGSKERPTLFQDLAFSMSASFGTLFLLGKYFCGTLVCMFGKYLGSTWEVLSCF